MRPALGAEPTDSETRREFRRVQLGVLLLGEGVLLFLGSVVRPETHPTLFVMTWFLAIVILLWLILLCFMDMVSVSVHHRRHREELLNEELRTMVSIRHYLNGTELGHDETNEKDRHDVITSDKINRGS